MNQTLFERVLRVIWQVAEVEVLGIEGVTHLVKAGRLRSCRQSGDIMRYVKISPNGTGGCGKVGAHRVMRARLNGGRCEPCLHSGARSRLNGTLPKVHNSGCGTPAKCHTMHDPGRINDLPIQLDRLRDESSADYRHPISGCT
jgi:hypothetical protein